MGGENLNSDSGFLAGESLYLSSRFKDITLLADSNSGYSRVFRAQRMGKWHVLKCLKPQYAEQKEYRALLQKEFEISYPLNHPNIVRTIGLEEVEGLGICVVMEYIEGRTLQSLIEKRQLDGSIARKIVVEICQALDYIHNRQIIHRDLKPSNVLITDNGQHIKLIDFGLSDADGYAILKQPAGTLKYAAPEQMQIGTKPDARADIYALGVMMHEMNSMVHSRKFHKVACQCMESDANLRYQSAAEVGRSIGQPRSYSMTVMVAVAIFFMGTTAYLLLRPFSESMSSLSGMEMTEAIDTVYLQVHDTVPPDVPIPDAMQQFTLESPRTDTIYKVVEHIQDDSRLKQLNAYARRLTQQMIEDSMTNEDFIALQDSIKSETERLLSPSAPEFSVYLTAAQNLSAQMVRDYNAKIGKKK